MSGASLLLLCFNKVSSYLLTEVTAATQHMVGVCCRAETARLAMDMGVAEVALAAYQLDAGIRAREGVTNDGDSGFVDHLKQYEEVRAGEGRPCEK